MKKILYTLSIFALAFGFQSCDKMLEFDPENVILAEDALQTPDDLQRLLNSCYDVLGNLYDGRVQVMTELMSDNLAIPANNNDFRAVFNRETNFFTTYTGSVYTDFYRAIFRVNTLLANFDLIDGLSAEDRNRIEAEGRFIRALCHWQVAQIWAQPYGYTADNSHLGIVLRTEPSNEALPRESVAAAYSLIQSDLAFARENLPMENGNYANRYAAFALSSVVAMQMLDWDNAAAYATEAINGPFQLDELDRFTENVSTETMFGIVSFVNDVRNEALRDNYRSDNNNNPQLGFSSDFNDLMSFTPTDVRNEWINELNGRYLVSKFDKDIFNIPVLHLTQIKLIRAEALALAGTDLGTAREDINDIRDRAFGVGINDISENATAEEIAEAARVEFRKETVGEGMWVNHLKRMGVMGMDITIRNAPWDCPGMALQFPNSESSVAGFIFNPEGGCLE